MAVIIISPAADADVDEILNYLAGKAGALVATNYEQRFDDLYTHLSLYPESCPTRPKLGLNTRIGIVSPYLILYRYAKEDDTIVIQRVVHGRRRLTGKLLREQKF